MKLLAVAAAFVASVAAMPGNGYPGSGYPGEGSPGGGYPGGGGSPGEGYPGNGSPGEGYPGGGSPGEGYPGGDSPGGYPGGGYPEGPNHYPVPGGTRFQDATNVCKSGKVMCCNQATYRNDVDTGNSGLLGVLNNAGGGPGAGVFNQCDNININSDDIVNDHCQSNVACCQSQNEQNGLINIGLPCIAIGSLL